MGEILPVPVEPGSGSEEQNINTLHEPLSDTARGNSRSNLRTTNEVFSVGVRVQDIFWVAKETTSTKGPSTGGGAAQREGIVLQVGTLLLCPLPPNNFTVFPSGIHFLAVRASALFKHNPKLLLPKPLIWSFF